MRRNASLTQQRSVPSVASRQVRRNPSFTGIQRRPLSRPVVPPIRTDNINDSSLSAREFEELEKSARNESVHDEKAEHAKKVLETLNNIHEGVKGSIDSSNRCQDEIITLMKDMKDGIDIIKSHIPRKNPECEVEMRDLLIDIRDEIKGLRKDVCKKGTDTINAVTDLKSDMSTTASIPLHRRESGIGKGHNNIEVVNAIRELQNAMETPRERLSSEDCTNTHEVFCEMRDVYRDQMVECNAAIDKIVSRLDDILLFSKEGKDIMQVRKQQETNILTEIKEALKNKVDMSSSTDYEQKYIDVKIVHENQFYKFSKILAMYHSAMLKLCGSDIPEAEEEFRKLSELVANITEDEQKV